MPVNILNKCNTTEKIFADIGQKSFQKKCDKLNMRGMMMLYHIFLMVEKKRVKQKQNLPLTPSINHRSMGQEYT